MSSHYIIRLEDNQNTVVEEIQDKVGLIDNVLVPWARLNKGQFQYVDPYGTTSFNGLQAESLLTELEGASRHVTDLMEAEVLRSLQRLARQCSEGSHLLLKLYGD